MASTAAGGTFDSRLLALPGWRFVCCVVVMIKGTPEGPAGD